MLAETISYEQVIELAGAPHGWGRLLGLAGVVAGLAFVIWMYRREGRTGASPPLRYFLAAVRCLLLIGLIVIWLRPVQVTYIESTLNAITAVLVDDSVSMTAAAADAQDPLTDTRGARVNTLLYEQDARWLRRLADNNELRVFAFGGTTASQPLPWEQDGGAEPTAEVTATRTDLGQALAAVADLQRAQPLAGVVVLSDGVVNSGMDADELRTYAQQLQAPVFSVGVGALEEPPNVRVAGLAAPSAVPQGDPFEVRLELEARGLPPLQLPVRLFATTADADGGNQERLVAERRVNFDPDEPVQVVTVPLDPAEPGDLVVRVELDTLPDETFPDDNYATTYVRVLGDRLRVLLVAGRPSYEYRFVTTLLERDNTIDLSTWLQSADREAIRDGDTVITRLPRRPEEIFAYDALLLFDPNPAELDSTWALAVRRFVDEFAGGVLYQAGTHFAVPFLGAAKLNDFVNILPAAPNSEAALRLREGGAYYTRQRGIALPADAVHPLVTFGAENTAAARIWEQIPAPWWTFPFGRTKPIASTLLEDPTSTPPAPLLAVQAFGAGRTALLATESTWRWRSTAQPLFERFWVEMVRYLTAPRRATDSSRGLLAVEPDPVEAGDFLRIEARVLDAQFVPWYADTVDAAVVLNETSELPVTLNAIPGRDGWYSGRLQMTEPGIGVVRLPLPTAASEAEAEPETLTKYFRVTQTDVEMRRLARDEAVLRGLAEASGATYVPITAADTIPDRIPAAAQVRVDRGPQEELWDEWWVLAILAGLLTIEWTLRRKHNLL
jgi:hypothetical protein